MALAFLQEETFASSREDVTISAPAAASVSISGTLRICAGGSTTLTANVSGCTGAPSYAWYRNGTFTANAGASTFIADEDGDYSVRVTCGGVTVTSETVKVSKFRLKTLVQNACPGSTGNVNLVLIDALADGISEFASFNWSNGATTEDLIGVTSGIYTVVATDINGCVASTTALVQNTIVNVSAGPDKSVCAGGSAQLQASGANNYSWIPSASLNNNIVNNPIASPASTTVYTVTGYVNSGDLVNNGSFNQRNVGFTSDYAFESGFAVGNYNSGTGLYPEGKYSVVPNRTDTNITLMHPSFQGVGHNKGLPAGKNDDFYMAINGSNTAGQIVWSQTVEVLPYTVYNFTTWISSIYLGNLSRLRFKINDDVLGNEIVAPNALNTWDQFFTAWNSGNTTTAVISIINNNLIQNGNDFGLDDISFSVSCMATDQVEVTVLPALTNNSITCPQVTSFCLSGDADLIVGSAPAGGNGTYTYQWEVSDDNIVFSSIDGATSANYNPGPVNVTTYFRRKVMSGDCSINSNVCTITIQGSIPNNVLTPPSPSTFCASGNPGNIIGTDLNNPTDLNTLYTWEYTTDGNEWFIIQGANGTSYDPATINTTTSYRRVASRGACSSGASNVITITINPLPVITIPAPAERCGPGTLTLEANAPGIIKWYAAAQGGVSLATGHIYTATNLQQTTSFYVEASNLGCTSARFEVPATINAKPTITSTTPGFRCGAGNVTVAASASAGVVNWYADAAGSLALGSGNSISVPVTGATTVYAIANDEGCTSASLTPVAITVGENTTASVSATACNSFTWELNGVTYTSSGIYYATSLNAAGCTLTTALNLTINTSSAVILNVSINEGDTYVFDGQNLTVSGQFIMNSIGANGCPMVTTLNLTVVPVSIPTDCGTNKIVNGDFEAGNTGFSSAYGYTADIAGNTELIPENLYGIGTNSPNYHPQFIGTGRTGKFLIVNGNTGVVKELWSQDVNVISGREYKFKMYTQNIYPTAPVRFSFRITPNDLLSSPIEFGTFDAVTGRNGWTEVTATYNSLYTGSAKLSIIDIDLTVFGNDFGIDDISFIETCPPIDCGTNKIVNGDFEAGNSGFFTSYTYTADIAGNLELFPENKYSVGTDASNYHPVFAGTGRTGNFLIVNGNIDFVKELWAQDVIVTSGREYKFKMFTQNLDPLAPVSFSFRITPNDLLSSPVEFGTFNATAGSGWVEVTATYNSVYTGSARLSIYDVNITASGNDFGIDDISLIETCPPIDCGTNKIANGNFEAGNSGFFTSYTYTDDIAGILELYPENKYSVGTDASNYHPEFIGTGRTGNFLIVNGNTGDIKEVWAQDVVVTSGREYKFKMYTQNIYPLAPVRFSFRITPNDLLSSPIEFGTFNAAVGRNGWVEVTATYNSLYTGSARLSIFDIDLTASGNDFGIDDISFIETCPPIDCGTNKIANGNFEAGNSGFFTSYSNTEDIAGNTELIPEDKYAVGTDASNYHPQFIGTGRSGNFLIVNGNTGDVIELWAQNVTVVSGREYQFKMYTQNLYPNSPVTFSFRITPNDLLSSPIQFGTFNAAVGRNGWVEVTATYNSLYTGSARLSIFDTNTSTDFGNDFGIDDISFIEVCPYADNKIAANRDNNENANEVASISVYPNPFSDLVNVSISTGDLDKTASIKVVNYLGQQVYTHSLSLTPSSEVNTSINLSDLTSGLYFLTVETNNSRETRKIVKK